MKLALLFLLCLTFLCFLNNAFAEGAPRPVVRVIYFLPKDRAPQRDINRKLDTLIKRVKGFYADEMQRHGYGRKTFRIETDKKSGNVVVHRLKGRFKASYYQHQMPIRVVKEVEEAFGRENINFIIIETHGKPLESGGHGSVDICGLGSDSHAGGGFALLPSSGGCVQGASGFELAAHELGHAFGLPHDFRNNAYIMSYGVSPNELSVCAAHGLSVHPFFEHHPNGGNRPATIQVRPPKASPPDSVRFGFTVSDAEGLHLIQLLIHGNLIACEKFNAERKSVTFQPTLRVGNFGTNFLVSATDVNGNVTRQNFEIDATPYLPPAKNISIPDRNLAAAVRTALDLPPRGKITHLDMLKLTDFSGSENPIKDLTGLEHAKNLKRFSHVAGQISDLTPLGGLMHLGELMLLVCDIGDIRPLKALNTLRSLHLSVNQIRDLTPLGDLTHLRVLSLGYNHINDITPLATIIELKTLWLGGNEIENIAVLRNMKSLEFLDLSENDIRNIAPLETLTHLEILDLRDNHIRNVSALAKMRTLKRLWVSGNPIDNLQPLRDLLQQNPGMQLDIEIPPAGEGVPAAPQLLPDQTQLLANFPNSFNPETWIPYQLAEPSEVSVCIYDVKGVLIRSLALGHLPAGVYQTRSRAAYWDGKNASGEPVASGVYFYTLTAGEFSATRKMLIRK